MKGLKRKITSRKFLLAIIGFVTALLALFNVDSLTTERVIALTNATVILVAYIVGEGMVDSARERNKREKKNE